MTGETLKESVAPERKLCKQFEHVEFALGAKKGKAFFGTYAALEFEPDGGEVCIIAPTPEGVGGPFYALTFCDCDMTKTREVAIVDAKAFRELVNFISEAQRERDVTESVDAKLAALKQTNGAMAAYIAGEPIEVARPGYDDPLVWRPWVAYTPTSKPLFNGPCLFRAALAKNPAAALAKNPTPSGTLITEASNLDGEASGPVGVGPAKFDSVSTAPRVGPAIIAPGVIEGCQVCGDLRCCCPDSPSEADIDPATHPSYRGTTTLSQRTAACNEQCEPDGCAECPLVTPVQRTPSGS
jgi:hypothetical protein